MKKFFITLILSIVALTGVNAQNQNPKLYDEDINPMTQIDQALKTAKKEGKFVICQVGGNWCPWCFRFNDFITLDKDIDKLVKSNFVYIHVNFPRKGADAKLSKKLGNPERFGFPSMVVLDTDGKVIHIQDSSFLEEDKSYNRDKVVRFFECWTPSAVKK